ncbi:MAG: hypothetical protein KC620_25215 [Myxococcales bacterium]|nr:hypothetical protein [Myxococcales bacterium]
MDFAGVAVHPGPMVLEHPLHYLGLIFLIAGLTLDAVALVLKVVGKPDHGYGAPVYVLLGLAALQPPLMTGLIYACAYLAGHVVLHLGVALLRGGRRQPRKRKRR